MELFKTAQRIPPRRIPVVRRYETIHQPMQMPVVNVRKTRGALTAIGGVAAVMVILSAIKMTDEPAPDPSAKPRSSQTAPSAAPTFRVIKPAGGGAAGGGGGGAFGPQAGPLVREKASENVLSQVRKIIFTLKKNPSTRENMTDRLATFGKYFNSLSPSDRIALFGTIDFRQLEHAVRVQGEKGPVALDRCLAQLQLIVF